MRPYFETRLGKLYCGDALEVLKQLPDESVDVVITSPPYWAKRVYSGAEKIWGGDPNCEHEWEFNTRLNSQGGFPNPKKANVGKDKLALGRFPVTEAFCKKCGAWYGQLGLEPSPQMFVEHLVEIFREVKRVLKPTGSLFVNIDDTWCGGGHGGLVKDSVKDPKYGAGRNFCPVVDWSNVKVPQRSLCLVPELFAIKMVYEEGWVLREKLIWSKKVHIYKDRTTIGNAMPESVKNRFAHTWEYIFHFTKKPSKYYFNLDAVRVPHKWADKDKRAQLRRVPHKESKYHGTELEGLAVVGYHPLGANPGDVVQINVRPFKDAHFAVFPPDLPELLIKAACPEEGVVLDPFTGAGTTLIVAEKMGRRWVGIEISPDYCEIIKRRFEREVGGLMKMVRITEFLNGYVRGS